MPEDSHNGGIRRRAKSEPICHSGAVPSDVHIVTKSSWQSGPITATVIAGLVLLSMLAACGNESGGSSTQGPRQVTTREATRMAETLFNNYELGGADFDLNAQMPDGTQVRMAGIVDWRSHSGAATVDITATADALVTEIMWGRDVLIERIPALTELTITARATSAEWFARVPDIEGRHLDSMIQLVTALASDRRGNPSLIAQEDGTAWLRNDTIPGLGIPAEVVRYGRTTQYWLDEDGVTMFRFEGNNSVFTRPVLIDLRDHGPRTVTTPLESDVVQHTDVVDFYAQVVAAR